MRNTLFKIVLLAPAVFVTVPAFDRADLFRWRLVHVQFPQNER